MEEKLSLVQIRNADIILDGHGVCVGVHCTACPLAQYESCFDRPGFSRTKEILRLVLLSREGWEK